MRSNAAVRRILSLLLIALMLSNHALAASRIAGVAI